MIKEVLEAKEINEFIYSLSRDDVTASYRRLDTMEDVDVTVTNYINSEPAKVLAYYKENRIIGAFAYSWEDDNMYAQSDVFIISEDYDVVAKEFINYAKRHLKGYEFIAGFSGYNVNALSFFKNENWKIIEDSHNLIADMEKYQVTEHNKEIYQITSDNFNEYYNFHDKYANPMGMYWNSEKLIKNLHQFKIFAYREEAVKASLFVRIGKDCAGNACAVIYGLFIDSDFRGNNIEAALMYEALNYIKSNFEGVKLVQRFIESHLTSEIELFLSNGFQLQDKYIGFKLDI